MMIVTPKLMMKFRVEGSLGEKIHFTYVVVSKATIAWYGSTFGYESGGKVFFVTL
jgi:hypothetical protein